MIVLGFFLIENIGDSAELSFVGALLVLLGGIFLGLWLSDNRITPLDVYRGKTELKIIETKIDTVVIKRDTIVVFKEEYL